MSENRIKDKSKNKTKREEIDKLFEGREHLKSKDIYDKEISKIKEILDLEASASDKFKYLFTSSIWASNAQDVKTILSIKKWEEPKYANLLAPNIWNCTPKRVNDVLELEALKEEKFQRLLSPNIWSYNPEFLKEFFSMTEWKNEAYQYLLIPSILEFTPQQISSTITLFEEFGIANYITNRCIRRDTSLQKKLLEYLKREKLPFLINDIDGKLKINPIINSSIFKLQSKYGISLAELEVNSYKNNIRKI